MSKKSQRAAGQQQQQQAATAANQDTNRRSAQQMAGSATASKSPAGNHQDDQQQQQQPQKMTSQPRKRARLGNESAPTAQSNQHELDKALELTKGEAVHELRVSIRQRRSQQSAQRPADRKPALAIEQAGQPERAEQQRRLPQQQQQQPPQQQLASQQAPQTTPPPQTASQQRKQLTEGANGRPTPGSATTSAGQNICAACERPIRERYLLMALDKHWHEDCLKCACCDCRLGEVGSSLFTHSDKILCRRDFLRIFGQHGNCAACKRSIPPYEMVMRANELAYHMDCFACQQCQYRFCVGDRFHLTETHKIICLLCHTDQQAQAQQQQQPGSVQQLPAPGNATSGGSLVDENDENEDDDTLGAMTALETRAVRLAGKLDAATGAAEETPDKTDSRECDEDSQNIRQCNNQISDEHAPPTVGAPNAADSARPLPPASKQNQACAV